MKTVLINLSLVVLFIAVSNSAAQAQCVAQSFEEKFKKSDLIFSGAVIGIFKTLPPCDGCFPPNSGKRLTPRPVYNVKVKIEKIWKGFFGGEEAEFSVGSFISDRELALSLREKQSVLVYAEQYKDEILSDGCNVLQKSDAKRDVRKLRRKNLSFVRRKVYVERKN